MKEVIEKLWGLVTAADMEGVDPGEPRFTVTDLVEILEQRKWTPIEATSTEYHAETQYGMDPEYDPAVE